MKSWFNTVHGPLYACVHLSEFPAQALLRLRSHLHGSAVAVLNDAAAGLRVCSVNAAARREGLRVGLTRVEAESIPGSTLLPRSVREEENARTTLLACVGSYAPEVETYHAAHAVGCVLMVAGMARSCDSPQAFAQAIREALRNHELYASVALSANFHTACLLAKAAPGISIVPPGEEQQALAPLLLHVLDLDEQQAGMMEMWGIRTLGGIAALPQKELIARIGKSGTRLRELARGEHPHLFAPVPVPLELREQYTFEVPVQLLEGLVFVVGPMLEQLVLRAGKRSLAIVSVSATFTLSANLLPGSAGGPTDSLEARKPVVSKVRWEVHHPDSRNLHLVAPMLASFRAAAENKEASRVAASAKAPAAPNIHKRTIRPALPTQDARLLLKLLRLDLAAHPPTSSVLTVMLEAEAEEKRRVRSGSFSPSLS